MELRKSIVSDMAKTAAQIVIKKIVLGTLLFNKRSGIFCKWFMPMPDFS